MITLLVDGSGGDVEVRLFAEWPKALKAFREVVKEFDEPMEIEHPRRGTWIASGERSVSCWVELTRTKVER